MQSLTFNNTQFDIVDRNGNPWVRANQIGLALEYKNPELSIAKLYRSNAEEFSDKMTALIEMPTKGGVQQVRIFSLRGAHLLAMFARTKVAKEFRHWVLDVLEGVAEVPSPAKEKRAPKALPNGLSTDQQEAIKALVKARVEALPKEKQAKAAVTCWSALKSKFGCSYKKIEPDQFADAVGLVARIELEGEWLPPASTPPECYPLSQHEAVNLSALFSCVDRMRELLQRLEPPLRQMDSRMAPAVYDGWHEVGLPLRLLGELRKHADTAYRQCLLQRPACP